MTNDIHVDDLTYIHLQRAVRRGVRIAKYTRTYRYRAIYHGSAYSISLSFFLSFTWLRPPKNVNNVSRVASQKRKKKYIFPPVYAEEKGGFFFCKKWTNLWNWARRNALNIFRRRTNERTHYPRGELRGMEFSDGARSGASLEDRTTTRFSMH